MGELTLAEHQVHTEVNLSLTSSTGQGRESPGSRYGQGEIPHQLTIMGKTTSTGEN